MDHMATVIRQATDDCVGSKVATVSVCEDITSLSWDVDTPDLSHLLCQLQCFHCRMLVQRWGAVTSLEKDVERCTAHSLHSAREVAAYFEIVSASAQSFASMAGSETENVISI